MAYNEKLTQRVRNLLVHLPDVQERKMFGSIGFMVNDKLCIGVGDHDDHIMMVRVGPEKYDKALGKKGARPAIMRGQERKGYVFLLDDAVKSQKDLESWVDMALEFNKDLK
jgi:TfoX/Sxy family transcriptional regulator of competence genes